MAASKRTPQHVQCLTCEHRWIAAHLPMEAGAFARLLKGLCCPMCGATTDDLRLRDANDIPETTVTISQALAAWLASGERGTSSNFMVQHLTGVPATSRHFNYGHPHDGDDLRRCMLLLEAVPELVPLLPKMATASPAWAALVPHWDELVGILKRELAREPGTCGRTYERMRQLLAPVDGGSLYETDGDWDAHEKRKREWKRKSRRRA